MKPKQTLSPKQKEKRNPLRSTMVILICSAFLLGLLASAKVAGVAEQSSVYAASDIDQDVKKMVPSGVAGMMSAVSGMPVPGAVIQRIGTSCEHVMVGQRFQKVKKMAVCMDLSSSMEYRVNELNEQTLNMAAKPKLMSDTDYDNLLRIVEAEAGTEDVKGRVLIANVIMNRVKNEEFPNNVSDVIWEVKNGVAQFSPIYDGTIYTVTISDKTREAVKLAMDGTDYSEGALFFIQRNAAEKNNITWFDNDLEKLFKHGVHEFYKYPEENS